MPRGTPKLLSKSTCCPGLLEWTNYPEVPAEGKDAKFKEESSEFSEF